MSLFVEFRESSSVKGVGGMLLNIDCMGWLARLECLQTAWFSPWERGVRRQCWESSDVAGEVLLVANLAFGSGTFWKLGQWKVAWLRDFTSLGMCPRYPLLWN